MSWSNSLRNRPGREIVFARAKLSNAWRAYLDVINNKVRTLDQMVFSWIYSSTQTSMLPVSFNPPYHIVSVVRTILLLSMIIFWLTFLSSSMWTWHATPPAVFLSNQFIISHIWENFTFLIIIDEKQKTSK